MQIIESLLSNDWYNFTMGQSAAHHYGEFEVRYQFTNRNTDFRSADYVDLGELREQIEAFRALRFGSDELDYLAGLGPFDETEIERLRNLRMPEVEIEVRDGQLVIGVEGKWCDTIYLETPVLGIVTELTSRRLLADQGRTTAEAERSALERLEPKIRLFAQNPGIKFAPFGSRRRASRQIERLVNARLMETIPDQIVGFSNVLDARMYGKPNSGTVAHQRDMLLAAYHIGIGTPNPLVAAIYESLDGWEADYAEIWGGGLLTMIPDTFTTEFFLKHLTAERARLWKTAKQDSGEPNAFNKKVIRRLGELDVPLADSRIIHTDALDPAKAVEIYRRWNNTITVGFGIGTNLTNDIGIPTHSYIWKPTGLWVNGVWIRCAKLTDNLRKASGDRDMIELMKREVDCKTTFSELQTV